MTKSAAKTAAKTAKSAAAKTGDKPAAKKAAKPAEATQATAADKVETTATTQGEASKPPVDPPVATPPKANKKNTDIIRVRSKGPRFRRAGIEFNRDGIDIDVSELSAEQIDAINDEPNLVVDGGAIPSDSNKATQ